MARRRTSGRFLGEYREGDGDPEEINAPVDIEADPIAGVVRTRIRETEDEVTGHRYAIAVAYFQQQLRRVENRDAYANRTITRLPKPTGKAVRRVSVPAGYVVCPDCASGLTDVWDCARCEGRGIVHKGE